MGRVAFFFIKHFLKCEGIYTPSHFRCDGVYKPSYLRCDGVTFSEWYIKYVALEILRRIAKEMVD